MEAVVLFEYEQQQGDELNLVVGEIISDVKQVQPHRQKRERGRGCGEGGGKDFENMEKPLWLQCVGMTI